MGYGCELLHEIELIGTIQHPNVIKAYMWDHVGADVYMYTGLYSTIKGAFFILTLQNIWIWISFVLLGRVYISTICR